MNKQETMGYKIVNTESPEKEKDAEQQILNALSHEYGLSVLKFLKEPEKGISSKNLIVSSEDGSSYFIKCFKKADTERVNISENAACFIGENSDLPVVLPLKNKEGGSHVVVDGQTYSIFPNMPHVQYSPESASEWVELSSRLGQFLGKIHLVSQEAEIPETIEMISRWTPDDPKEAIAKYEKIKSIIERKTATDEYDKKALEFIQLKTDLIAQNEFTEREQQPLVVCHGDYHKDNLLLNERGEIIGICDWDISGKANPYVEFIRSFSMCVIRRDFEHLQDKKEMAKAFLDGYRDNCGFVFDIEELKLSIESWYQKLLTSPWPLTDHYYQLSDGSKTDNVLFSEYKKVTFLRDRRNELAKLIESCM
jgi:Ser/Thr protein kinase RdoA (MazF antagonist)